MRVNNFATSFFNKRNLKPITLLRVGLIALLLCNFACIPRRTTLDAIYLIPQGYEGAVLIFFDEPDGALNRKAKVGSMFIKFRQMVCCG